MPLKFVNAHDLRSGSYLLVDNAPCVVKTIDLSKTGKHGASKARIEAIGIIDGKKRVVVKPGHEKFAVPLIEKRKGQVLSIDGENANLMDIENFETLTVKIPEELKEAISEGIQVEYWNVEEQRIIKRTL
jgi:translation initiation factor 5A